MCSDSLVGTDCVESSILARIVYPTGLLQLQMGMACCVDGMCLSVCQSLGTGYHK